jgi:hypothetical protein
MKKKVRKILELLMLLYNVYYSKRYPYDGFCATLNMMYTRGNLISEEEYGLLYNYIFENRPKSYHKHMPYYFPKTNRFVRCQWLRKHIKKNTKTKKHVN